MAVLVPPETRFGIETWKWEHTDGETNPFDSTVKGMRPSHHKFYPAMMYKAVQKNPWQFEKLIVDTETEQRNLESRGFVAGGQGAAADAFDKAQQEVAVLAAARNYEDRNMSDKAREESNAAEQSSSSHLAEIPVTPIKKGNR